MHITDIVATAFNGALARLAGATGKLKRNVLLYAVCGFCGIFAVVYAASASVLALENAVGPIYARLILAGAFALVVAAIMLSLWLARPAQAPAPLRMPLQAEAQAQAAQRSAQFAQLAMIIEAVMLGYSMARRR